MKKDSMKRRHARASRRQREKTQASEKEQEVTALRIAKPANADANAIASVTGHAAVRTSLRGVLSHTAG